MCGIIGVTGRASAVEDILSGLRRLEYRGYDSSGVVAVVADGLGVVKRSGKLDRLTEALSTEVLTGSTGIGHTRWATHGAPNDENAHPHLDPSGRVAVVHNGIIENYRSLRAELNGAAFASDTDTEVVAHLIARELDATDHPDLLEAVRRIVGRLDGAYALCVLSADEPDTIVVARQQAPLIVAAIDGMGLCASDIAALIEHTDTCAALLDGQIARVRPGGYEVFGPDGSPAAPDVFTVDWDLSAAEKQGYDHFMLKEIHEQPLAVAETLLGRDDGSGRIVLDELRIEASELARADKVFILAAGTSLNAGMAGKIAIEHWAGIPVEVEVASEFRYRDPIVNGRTLVIAVSQSGETIDTIAAAEHARTQGAPVIAITNVVGSTLARMADGVLYTRAGPEIAVASTKAFTTQIVGSLILALYLAQRKDRIFASEVSDVLASLDQLPGLINQVVENDAAIRVAAEQFQNVGYTMFIGRHASLPIAFEGALKLKEVSYLHAEAFPAGEMKHGPIALIEPGSLVVAVAHDGHVFSKMVSNIQEVRARGASVLAIGTEASRAELEMHADMVITVPDSPHELATSVLTVLPLQLYAYHVAVLRGADVDQPRNLAKTVTVE